MTNSPNYSHYSVMLDGLSDEDYALALGLEEELEYDPDHCRTCGKGDDHGETLWFDEFADHYHMTCIPGGTK